MTYTPKSKRGLHGQTMSKKRFKAMILVPQNWTRDDVVKYLSRDKMVYVDTVSDEIIGYHPQGD